MSITFIQQQPEGDVTLPARISQHWWKSVVCPLLKNKRIIKDILTFCG